MLYYIFAQITSLSQPYGECEETVPVSNCKLECKADHVTTQCGCADIYMPNKDQCHFL